MFSWSIELIQSSPDRLEIIDPPFTPGAVAFGVIAAAGLLVVIFFPAGWMDSWYQRVSHSSGLPPQLGRWMATFLRVVLAGVALLFGAIGWGLWQTRSTAIFSRNASTLEVVSRNFGFSQRTSVPLQEIRSVEVETGRWARRLIVTLKSGEVIQLTGHSNRQGHYQGAQAIRDFLNLESRR